MILPQIRDSLVIEMQEGISVNTISSLSVYKEVGEKTNVWKKDFFVFSSASTKVLITNPISPNVVVEIENIFIHNKDVITHNFIMYWLTNSTSVPIFKLVLNAGESFRYFNNVFSVYDENGIVKNNTTGLSSGGGGSTNLSYDTSTRTILSDTGTDATLPLFSSTVAGLTPLSGGGTTEFLRADGTWQVVGTHVFANQALLDSYTQLEVDLADAVSKKHTHSNISILNAITESFTTALKTAYDNTITWISVNGSNLIAHLTNTSNPHNVTKTQIGLSNVDDTSDSNKPISIATQIALDDKADVNHTHFVNEIEIDFGTDPLTSKRFTIINGSVINTNKIIVTPSGNIATNRGIDDWEWDTINFAAKANNGDFTLFAKSNTRIAGKRKIFYTIN